MRFGDWASDGARLLRLARGGPQAEREAAIRSLVAMASARTAPRDWPDETVRAATNGIEPRPPVSPRPRPLPPRSSGEGRIRSRFDKAADRATLAGDGVRVESWTLTGKNARDEAVRMAEASSSTVPHRLDGTGTIPIHY